MQKLWFACLLCLTLGGCGPAKPTNPDVDSSTQPDSTETVGPATDALPSDSLNASMDTSTVPELDLNTPNARLLVARLTPEQLEEGWVRLYDGFEMTGWFFIGNANWTFDEGMIVVDGGEPSLLCTNFQVSDFELQIEFNCSARTDSGILLRTTADPHDMSRDCYELNIAPDDNAYPTGSLVNRKKVDRNETGAVEPDEWHAYRVRAEGDRVKVWLDGKPILEYSDARHLRRGYIGLQHNLGVARFRNILLRPLGGQDLAVDKDWQSAWKPLEHASPNFKVEAVDDGLHLQGGPGQLESTQQYDDFVLQATYQVANSTVDSGILFRGLADRYNEAYECQIYHGPAQVGPGKANARLQAGALNIPTKGEFSNVRVLASDGLSRTYLTLISDEGQFTSFVNGLLVADMADTREASANPRAGFRREAGKLALQAPNENCDITFHRLNISPIYRR